MSRNYGTSSCCSNVVRLSDLVGEPIEFRKYGNLAPQIGTKWKCSDCKKVYFVIWKRYDKFWHKPSDSQEDILIDKNGNSEYNDYKNNFTKIDSDGNLEDTGAFSLILSFYDELWKNDEWHRCDYDTDTQLVWFYDVVEFCW